MGNFCMLQPIAILASIAGLGFALAAFLLADTGVTGTAGAGLAVVGSAASLMGVLLLTAVRPSRGVYFVLAILTVLAAALTALAGWFLMQDALTIAMVVAFIAIFGVAVLPRPNRAGRPR
jgi:hypothetical protein